MAYMYVHPTLHQKEKQIHVLSRQNVYVLIRMFFFCYFRSFTIYK